MANNYRVTIKEIKKALASAGVNYSPDASIEVFKKELKEAVKKGLISSLEMIEILEKIKIYREDLQRILSNKKKPKPKGQYKKFCKTCEKEIDPYAKFCRECWLKELKKRKKEKEILYQQAQKNGINVFVKVKPGKDIMNHPKTFQGGSPGLGKKPGKRFTSL